MAWGREGEPDCCTLSSFRSPSRVHPGYDGEMDNGKPIPAGLIAIYIVFGAFYLLPLAFSNPVFGTVLGLTGGAAFVACVASLVNRRHDPRHKQPPDAP